MCLYVDSRRPLRSQFLDLVPDVHSALPLMQQGAEPKPDSLPLNLASNGLDVG
jgi:hypothetical protein